MARDFFGTDDPVGQPLRRVIEDSNAIVIGVVSNAITARLRELGSATVYQPMKEALAAKLLVRSAGPRRHWCHRSGARSTRSIRAHG